MTSYALLSRPYVSHNSGLISKQEFIDGCKLLNESLANEEQIRDAEKIANLLDITGKGHIDINEFFEMFRIADVHSDSALSETLKLHSHKMPSLAGKKRISETNLAGMAADGSKPKTHNRHPSSGEFTSTAAAAAKVVEDKSVIAPDSIVLPPPISAASLSAKGQVVLPPPSPSLDSILPPPVRKSPRGDESQAGSWFGLGRSSSKTGLGAAKSLHGIGSSPSLKNLDPLGASLHGAALSQRDAETLRRIASVRDPLAASLHGLGSSEHNLVKVTSRKDIDPLNASVHAFQQQDDRRELLLKNVASVKSLDINELDKRSQTRLKRSQSGAFNTAAEDSIAGRTIQIDTPVRDSRSRTLSTLGRQQSTDSSTGEPKST
jgi:hypothetical protein